MVEKEVRNIEFLEQEEEKAGTLSRANMEPSLPTRDGDFSKLGEVDWNSLAADFRLKTQPVS